MITCTICVKACLHHPHLFSLTSFFACAKWSYPHGHTLSASISTEIEHFLCIFSKWWNRNDTLLFSYSKNLIDAALNVVELVFCIPLISFCFHTLYTGPRFIFWLSHHRTTYFTIALNVASDFIHTIQSALPSFP